jgi:ERCC4-type nuclease
MVWLDVPFTQSPGSTPGLSTANRLDSLVHQRGGKAVTLENTEKARGRQPGETGNQENRARLTAGKTAMVVGITTKGFPPLILRNPGSRPGWPFSTLKNGGNPMAITAVIIDQREPEWVKQLQFGGVAVSHSVLDAGDLWVLTDDNRMLVIERKTANDFLNTLKEERLFVQMAGLQELRNQGYWPYVMISGELQRGQNGHVVTDRETGWSWNAVQGALLSIQEMGIFVTYCAHEYDLESAVIRLGERSRDEKMIIPPSRIGKVLGLQAGFLCGLPGIGPEKVGELLNYCGTPAWALVALTDADSQVPGIGPGIRNNVRYTLGLKDDEQMGILTNDRGDEVLKILPLGAQ